MPWKLPGQRNPKPGKEVRFSQLRDGLMVRVPGDLASYERYCFDFVNCDRQYILTPVDVKIYTVATAFTPSAQDVQVLSIEQSLEKGEGDIVIFQRNQA